MRYYFLFYLCFLFIFFSSVYSSSYPNSSETSCDNYLFHDRNTIAQLVATHEEYENMLSNNIESNDNNNDGNESDSFSCSDTDDIDPICDIEQNY